MGPTEIIKEWFDGEVREVQGDIAFLMLSSLGDGEDLLVSLDELISHLREWLTPDDEQRFRSVGKALSFVAVFDFIFGDRFAPEGWERPRRIFEQVILDAPSDSMVETAKTSIADMPRKQELWAGVGERWQEVKSRLSPAYLETWNFAK